VTAPLGIDLGTTYSVVATVVGGEPTVLRNPVGEETTPSVVCFESPGSVQVGAAAKAAAPVLPDLTVALVKRLMGLDRRFCFHGAEYSPESISALLLRALVDGALPDRGGATVPAVITVPAYFGIREREATQQAGLMAGLDVLELVSEPLAAAIHYGFSGQPSGGAVLVYDLGGGTFDATVLAFDGGARVVATDGDTELGGADWDRRLAAHLLDTFVDRARPAQDPADDPAFMEQLTLTAETLKRALTTTTSHQVRIRGCGRAVTLGVTRAELELMTRDLVDSSVACVRRLLAAAAARGAPPVSHCLLVGGASRMPMIGAAVAAEFGWQVRLHDPDLAVAKGAAIRAQQLFREGPDWRTPHWGFEVADPHRPAAPPAPPERERPGWTATANPVVARSLGLLVHDSHDRSGQRRFVDHLIHQHDPLPVTGRDAVVATILDDQRSVRIEVFEQAGAVPSAEVAHNRRVLDGELSGLPAPLPAGSPIRIGLALGRDGRISVTAAEPASGATLTLEAYIDGVLDTAERERMARSLSGLTIRQ
jgi:molecular chaperone DnaK (HSP70)